METPIDSLIEPIKHNLSKAHESKAKLQKAITSNSDIVRDARGWRDREGSGEIRVEHLGVGVLGFGEFRVLGFMIMGVCRAHTFGIWVNVALAIVTMKKLKPPHGNPWPSCSQEPAPTLAVRRKEDPGEVTEGPKEEVHHAALRATRRTSEKGVWPRGSGTCFGT